MDIKGNDLFNDIKEELCYDFFTYSKESCMLKHEFFRLDPLCNSLINKNISSIKFNIFSEQNDCEMECSFTIGGETVCSKKIKSGDELIPNGILLLNPLLIYYEPEFRFISYKNIKDGTLIKFSIKYVNFKTFELKISDTICFKINDEISLKYEQGKTRIIINDEKILERIKNEYFKEIRKIPQDNIKSEILGKLNGVKISTNCSQIGIQMLMEQKLDFVIDNTVKNSKCDSENYIIEKSNGKLIQQTRFYLLREGDAITNILIDLEKYSNKNNVNIYFSIENHNEIKQIEFDQNKIYNLLNQKRNNCYLVIESPIEKLKYEYDDEIKINIDYICFSTDIRCKLVDEEKFEIEINRLNELKEENTISSC